MRLEDLIGRDYTVTGNGRYLKTLEHDSLVIDTDSQVFYWNSRELYGDTYIWLTKVKGIPHEQAKKYKRELPSSVFDRHVEDKKDAVVVLPDLVEIFYNIGKNHREYWYDVRGYTEETVDGFRLGYSGTGWHTIPIFVEGAFRNFQCRREHSRIMRPWYRDMGALPFNFGILNVCSEVYLTEGPVDAIMLRQHGLPAISQTSGAGGVKVYGRNFSSFSSISRVNIVYDNDKAGNHGSKEVAKLFGEKATIYNLWDFDAGFDVSDFFNAGNSVDDFVKLVEEKGKKVYEIS